VFQSRFAQGLSLFLTVALAAGWAATGGIGIATSSGSFRVGQAPVTGNATLFEGSVVETSGTPSVLDLNGGTRLELGAGSRGTVYRDRLILEKGTGRVQGQSGYRLEVRNLHVLPSPAGAARVQVGTGNIVEVEAVSAPVSVTTSGGLLVASVAAGNSLAFEPQAAGAEAPFTVSGCVQKVGDGFELRDDTASVTFRLRGSGLEKYAGRRVEIIGANHGDPNAIQVAKVKVLSGGCPAPGTPRDAGTKAGGKATTAAGGGTKKAVIAGVIVAAGAGASAAVALSDEEPQGTVSR